MSTRFHGTEWGRVAKVVLWVAGFIALLGLTHYLIAVGAFVALITRLESKEPWKTAMVLAICVDAGFFVLFEIILKAQL